MISKSRRDSAGGGSSRIFFRDLQEPTWFSGGGCSRFFRDLQRLPEIPGDLAGLHLRCSLDGNLVKAC